MTTDFLAIFGPDNTDALDEMDSAALAELTQKLRLLRPIREFLAAPRAARGDQNLLIRTDRGELLALGAEPDALMVAATRGASNSTGRFIPEGDDDGDADIRLWTLRYVDAELRIATGALAADARKSSDLPRVLGVDVVSILSVDNGEGRDQFGTAPMTSMAWEAEFDEGELRKLREYIAALPSFDEYFERRQPQGIFVVMQASSGHFVGLAGDAASLTVYTVPVVATDGGWSAAGHPSMRLIRAFDGATCLLDEHEARGAVLGEPVPVLVGIRAFLDGAALHLVEGGTA